MKVSELIKALDEYMHSHGDDVLEFVNDHEGVCMELTKIHDGYCSPKYNFKSGKVEYERVCELTFEG